MRRAPSNNPEGHSSNIPASTDSHCRGIQAANIPAAAAAAVAPESPAGYRSYPASWCRCRNNFGSGQNRFAAVARARPAAGRSGPARAAEQAVAPVAVVRAGSRAADSSAVQADSPAADCRRSPATRPWGPDWRYRRRSATGRSAPVGPAC